MRRTRMDELPAVLERAEGGHEPWWVHGPERQHFIDAITGGAPALPPPAQSAPGPITSWGQVKFGYAENVDQMVRRLKYDVLYIENMSLAVDLKILAYTVLIILKGDGK
jgi:lipopolysaccharide/colanic/teichoic acid biosynthesis glycosyltransferase